MMMAWAEMAFEQVAEVAVDALITPAAVNKVVEIISRPDAPSRSIADLFESVWRRRGLRDIMPTSPFVNAAIFKCVHVGLNAK